MTYSLSRESFIIRDSDGAFIPKDPNNQDYAAYLLWVAAGNSPTAYVAPPMSWSQYQVSAQAALDKSDTTMHRVAEGVALGKTTWQAADVVAWVNYRIELRAIVSSKSGTPGTLPTQPPYPSGT